MLKTIIHKCILRKDCLVLNRTVQCNVIKFLRKNYSRFSATTIMTGTDIFSLNDYDCIGFDLDNTLLRYNISNMVRMEYDVLANYLISHKGYSADCLKKSIDNELEFLQKGLIIDFKLGNILKISGNGIILKAAHGTKLLTNSEILSIYGPKREWEATTLFSNNLLCGWNGPLSQEFRTLCDYFDMPAGLIFARIIDSIDDANSKNTNKKTYDIWPDILQGLVHMFAKEHFSGNQSEYFNTIKEDPGKYIHKTNQNVLNWLKTLKNKKKIFLLTGSHIDFANFTASYALGEDWKDLFDIIVVFGKKPSFFVDTRPFLMLDGTKETMPLSVNDLQVGSVYSQGNFNDLNIWFRKITNKSDLKYLYVGDNLIQDVYAPCKYQNIDTITVVEEMFGDLDKQFHLSNDYKILTSRFWGPFLSNIDDEPTLWLETIRKYSKLCIPLVDVIASKKLNTVYKTFSTHNTNDGFYPETINSSD